MYDEYQYSICLSDNNLTGKIDQTFPNNVKISMYCDANQLTSLNVTKCTALIELCCYDNKILQEIPGWFSQLEDFSYDKRFDYFAIFFNRITIVSYFSTIKVC